MRLCLKLRQGQAFGVHFLSQRFPKAFGLWRVRAEPGLASFDHAPLDPEARCSQYAGVSKRVYLAGPDVFLPDVVQRAERLKHVCARHGLVGVFPLDPLPDEPAGWSALPLARAIARRNEAHIRRCDGLVANLTPFRGPGADGGTAYELGFARALGRPVFGWSNAAGSYLDRCALWPGATRQGRAWLDPDGLEIEAFGLPDNLMMACALSESGADMMADGPAAAWSDLGAYERCVMLAAKVLGVRPEDPATDA